MWNIKPRYNDIKYLNLLSQVKIQNTHFQNWSIPNCRKLRNLQTSINLKIFSNHLRTSVTTESSSGTCENVRSIVKCRESRYLHMYWLTLNYFVRHYWSLKSFIYEEKYKEKKTKQRVLVRHHILTSQYPVEFYSTMATFIHHYF